MDKSYIQCMAEEQWGKDEWFKFSDKLRQLPVGELVKLADSLGVKFAKTKGLTTEDIVLALDEADKESLISAYNNLVEGK